MRRLLLLLTCLVVALTPGLSAAQILGNVRVAVDRPSYQIGDPIVVSYDIPRPGGIRLWLATAAGRRVVTQLNAAQGGAGQIQLVAGAPVGEHQLTLE